MHNGAPRECRYIKSENNRISVHLQRRVRVQLLYVRLHVRGIPERNCLSIMMYIVTEVTAVIISTVATITYLNRLMQSNREQRH